MKKIAFIFALSLGVLISASAQTKKGPAYKNAHPADKYDGTSTVLVEEDPGSLQGPAYKNYKHAHVKKSEGSDDLYVSTRRGTYKANAQDTKTFKSVEIKANSKKKNLKGPAYKNYRPGKK